MVTRSCNVYVVPSFEMSENRQTQSQPTWYRESTMRTLYDSVFDGFPQQKRKWSGSPVSPGVSGMNVVGQASVIREPQCREQLDWRTDSDTLRLQYSDILAHAQQATELLNQLQRSVETQHENPGLHPQSSSQEGKLILLTMIIDFWRTTTDATYSYWSDWSSSSPTKWKERFDSWNGAGYWSKEFCCILWIIEKVYIISMTHIFLRLSEYWNLRKL